MSTIRFIPLPIHAALRMVTGLLTMIVPFAVGLAPGPSIVLAVVGAVVTGVALAATPDATNRMRVRAADVKAFDAAAVIGLLGAALAFGLAGDSAALITSAAVAIVWLLGNTATRYSLSY